MDISFVFCLTFYHSEISVFYRYMLQLCAPSCIGGNSLHFYKTSFTYAILYTQRTKLKHKIFSLCTVDDQSFTKMSKMASSMFLIKLSQWIYYCLHFLYKEWDHKLNTHLQAFELPWWCGVQVWSSQMLLAHKFQRFFPAEGNVHLRLEF